MCNSERVASLVREDRGAAREATDLARFGVWPTVEALEHPSDGVDAYTLVEPGLSEDEVPAVFGVEIHRGDPQVNDGVVGDAFLQDVIHDRARLVLHPGSLA